jgi:acetyl-CoA carboxylase carboxyltransferase component
MNDRMFCNMWMRTQVAAMNGEMMATIQEVEKIHAGLKAKCVERAHLRAEITHYEEKVCDCRGGLA